MPRLSPPLLLGVLVIGGIIAGVLTYRPLPPEPTPAPTPEIASSSAPAVENQEQQAQEPVLSPVAVGQPIIPSPSGESEDLRQQLALMEGQVEYLQGQVKALQEENAALLEKLGTLGVKGMPKMDPLPSEETPDFVGMGVDMMKLRKLQALPIPTTGTSIAEVEASILRWLRQQQPGDEGPRFGLALAALGWIDKPVDPLPLRAALLARQLGGWYDTEKGTLLTVDTNVQPNGRPSVDKPLAIAFGQLLREYGTTLFPQSTDGSRITTDRRLARESLLAGDAGLTRFLFGLQNPTALPKNDLPSADPDHPLNEVHMPAYLRELYLFPFIRGFEFAQTLHSAGEYAQLNAAYSRPPIQTAEVIEAERYLDNNPLPSPRIDWPSGTVAGSEPYWDDSLGKFACFTTLRSYNDDEAAGQGAKGWLADRLLVYLADGEASRDHAAWQLLFVAPENATAFFKAMRNCLLQRYDTQAATDTPDHISFETLGRTVHLIKNRAGAGVLLIDAASADFASALRKALDSVSKTAQ